VVPTYRLSSDTRWTSIALHSATWTIVWYAPRLFQASLAVKLWTGRQDWCLLCSQVTGSTDRSVALWDRRNGQMVRWYRGHRSAVNCVKIAPNDNWIASVRCDCHHALPSQPPHTQPSIPQSFFSCSFRLTQITTLCFGIFVRHPTRHTCMGTRCVLGAKDDCCIDTQGNECRA